MEKQITPTVGHSVHNRHMAQIAIACLAIVVFIAGLGVYVYASGPHMSYHCPTVTVATARC